MYVTSFILMKLNNSYVILELVKVPFASTAAQPFAFTSISQTNLYINMAYRFSKKKRIVAVWTCITEQSICTFSINVNMRFQTASVKFLRICI